MIADPIEAGLARGWKVIDASALTADKTVECDVAIIGTGAGGGVTAEILSAAGLNVVLIEEGPLKSSRDFKMREREAYPQLYQESAARQTKDKGITILQGRSVGGSTTVNWTSSFRTPSPTLNHWRNAHGLSLTADTLAPWFARMEQRLNIAPWDVPPNANNDLLRIGCTKLGYSSDLIRRNVRGCWNLGYCGMGCPTNAKQSMLVSTIPAALDRGATLIHHARAERLQLANNRITGLELVAMDAAQPQTRNIRLRVVARHYVAAAGAIGTPALLLRSGISDPGGRIGKRTFLHPVVLAAAVMPEKVEGHSGAPQTVYSDHFIENAPANGPIGFKLEAPPLHPLLTSINLSGFGKDHAALMTRFPYVHALIALMRDGFHPESVGGTVGLRKDGTPLLDYPITPYVWEGARRALATMAEIQFAAGARYVMFGHDGAVPARTWADAKRQIAELPMALLRTRVVSAHVMGGAAMSADAGKGVVNDLGRSWTTDNLSVIDGSVFPTSIGANPQLSIYGFASRAATTLAESLRR